MNTTQLIQIFKKNKISHRSQVDQNFFKLITPIKCWHKPHGQNTVIETCIFQCNADKRYFCLETIQAFMGFQFIDCYEVYSIEKFEVYVYKRS